MKVHLNDCRSFHLQYPLNKWLFYNSNNPLPQKFPLFLFFVGDMSNCITSWFISFSYPHGSFVLLICLPISNLLFDFVMMLTLSVFLTHLFSYLIKTFSDLEKLAVFRLRRAFNIWVLVFFRSGKTPSIFS